MKGMNYDMEQRRNVQEISENMEGIREIRDLSYRNHFESHMVVSVLPDFKN
jgi:hypothetical protein